MRSMIQQQLHSPSHALTQGNNRNTNNITSNNNNNITNTTTTTSSNNNIINSKYKSNINYYINNWRGNSNISVSENKKLASTSSSPVWYIGNTGYRINSPSTASASIAAAREAAEHKASQLHHQIPLPDHLLLMESSLHHSQHGSSNACYNGKSGSHSMVIKTQIGARKVATSPASPSAHPHPHPVTASSGSTLVSNVRVIRLKRPSNSPLGFSVKGGWEHGTGVFVTEVTAGSEADRQGLLPGDQILRVNGVNTEQSSHEEVINLIRSNYKITLKVQSVGTIPCTGTGHGVDSNCHMSQLDISTTCSTNGNNSHRTAPFLTTFASPAQFGNQHQPAQQQQVTLHHQQQHYQQQHHLHQQQQQASPHHQANCPTWKYVVNPSASSTLSHTNGGGGVKNTCPIHNSMGSVGSVSPSSTFSSSSSTSSSFSSPPCTSPSLMEPNSINNNNNNNNQYQLSQQPLPQVEIIEEKIYITLKAGESLGCSVVKGPPVYPGIFVQEIKPNGIAQSSGLEVGDQIIGMNGFSFYPGHYDFNEAMAKIKACQQMTLTVRKKVGINLFREFNEMVNQQKQQQQNEQNQLQLRNSVNCQLPDNESPMTATIVTSGNKKIHLIKAVVHSGSNGVNGHMSQSTTHFDEPEVDYDKSDFESLNSGYNGQMNYHTKQTSGKSVKPPAPPPRNATTTSASSSMAACRMHPSPPQHPAPHASSHHRAATIVSPNGEMKHLLISSDELKLLEKVKEEEDRLAEERRKLHLEQVKLQEELKKLAIERKQLETIRIQSGASSYSSRTSEHLLTRSLDDGSSLAGSDSASLSSTSTDSGTIMNNSASTSSSSSASSSTSSSSSSTSSSPVSSFSASGTNCSASSFATNGGGNGNGSTSGRQMGFLDELKKLAENRSGNSDGLLIDTLKKTNTTSTSKSLPGMKVVKQLHPDDHKRKQHEMLMEEFKSAHMRMFGKQNSSLASTTCNSSCDSDEESEKDAADKGRALRSIAIGSNLKVAPGEGKLTINSTEYTSQANGGCNTSSSSSGISSAGSASPCLSGKSVPCSSIESASSTSALASGPTGSNDSSTSNDASSVKQQEHQTSVIGNLKQNNNSPSTQYNGTSSGQQLTVDHNNKVRILKTLQGSSNSNGSTNHNNNNKHMNGHTINGNNSGNGSNIATSTTDTTTTTTNTNSNSTRSNNIASSNNNIANKGPGAIVMNGLRKMNPAPPPPPPPLPSTGSNSKNAPSVTITSYRRTSSTAASSGVTGEIGSSAPASSNKPLPVKINLIQSSEFVSRM